MYEQIYALAGPTQTYRITGDPKILKDAELTIQLFKRFYRDEDQGGYFSHLDALTLDPRSEGLGPNRARKNWNSVGDHATAAGSGAAHRYNCRSGAGVGNVERDT